MKQVQDVVERLWDFIDKLDINTFRKFLADNIVGSVVAFSLLFWVPFSILVHFVVRTSSSDEAACLFGVFSFKIIFRRLKGFCLNDSVLFVVSGQEDGQTI